MVPKTKNNNVLSYLAAGATYCILLITGGDLLALFIGQEGGVWTPINSPAWRIGDSYYYSAWVAEGIQHGFPPKSPTAVEYSDRPILETLRWFPLFIAGLPGLVISDYRFVYLLNYCFTAALFFGFPFGAAYYFTRSKLGGLLIGVTVLFLTPQWWSYMPSTIYFPGLGNFLYWVQKCIFRPYYGSLEFLPVYEYEALQDALRYINLSVTGPLLMLYAGLCHLVYSRSSFKSVSSVLVAVALLAISPFMAFSYPSHALIAYSVLGGYGVFAFLRGHRIASAILITIGLVTAAILLFSGYLQFSRGVFAENELWNNIFHKEGLTLIDRPIWLMIVIAFINKYTITFVLALWFTWKDRELRDVVCLFGSIGFGLMLTSLFNIPLISSRFLARGIDHLWFMIFLISALYGYKNRQNLFFEWVVPWTGKWSRGQTPNRSLVKISRIAKHVLVLSILAVPLLGFGQYNIQSARNGTRFMPEERWDALQWVNGALTNGVEYENIVAALDWDDITFLPIYTPAYLLVDNMIVGGRSPLEEMKRYVTLWKILGYPRAKLENRFTMMVESALQQRTSDRQRLLNPPLVQTHAYASGQIATAIIYWPYVSEVAGVIVAADSKTTPAFVSWAMDLYDDVDLNSALIEFPFSYVMVSGVERDIPLKPFVSLEIVYENPTHKIFKVNVE